MTRNRALAGGVIALAGLEAALAVGPWLLRFHPWPLPVVIADITTGLAFVCAGLIGARAEPSSRVGMLMVLVGLGALLENALLINWWPAYLLLLIETGLPLGLVGQLFLTFPTGRFKDGFDRALMYALY